MELKVLERLVVLNVLPVTGTLINLRLVRELREDLSFSDEENQEMEIRVEGEQVRWDDAVEAERGLKVVEISSTMLDLVVGAFGALDAEAKLHLEQIGVYERFLQERVDRDARIKAMVDGSD